jgi:hypothetical protein
MVRSLKFELSQELDDERTRKNNRLDEVTRLINTHKNLLDEHIRQQGESLKALLKANLNEESAQRHREDDRIIQIMNKRVEAVERLMDSKMPEEVNRLIMQIEKNRLEFLDSRDNLEKQIAVLENKEAVPQKAPEAAPAEVPKDKA